MMLAQNAPAISTSAPAAIPNPASAIGPQFEVASVRQNLTPEPRWRMSFTDDGVSAKDVTLLYAIEEAYGLYDEQLWSGIAPWIKEKRLERDRGVRSGIAIPQSPLCSAFRHLSHWRALPCASLGVLALPSLWPSWPSSGSFHIRVLGSNGTENSLKDSGDLDNRIPRPSQYTANLPGHRGAPAPRGCLLMSS